ncbi:arginyltransferase [Crateriforma conspicua]|uniref:Aspartate/glutamate leucyltransferase n=1 Tax=Crateriforma conspicua TaxID=2527996 RepID=A0A5C6FRX2_9PLAN|nr:arginyltransferase [Crateriforma conspicua]TWU65837.1 arginyl-tRNA-protein transferase [Crateriforma conspicua]
MRHPPKQPTATGTPYRMVVVQDMPQTCPYLPDQIARMPLQLPVVPIDPGFTDWTLDRGYRRSGDFVYRTRCGECQECQPTRIRVDDFRWTRSFRRVFKRGQRDLIQHWDRPVVTEDRVNLFNRHRTVRGLDHTDEAVDSHAYHAFLISSFGQVDEWSVWDGDRLIGISIVDVGQDCLSAVYTMFDPDYSRYSLGTYAILQQIVRAQREKLSFVYLGMYVKDNPHLNYKARFGPQERLRDEAWSTFDRETLTDQP